MLGQFEGAEAEGTWSDGDVSVVSGNGLGVESTGVVWDGSADPGETGGQPEIGWGPGDFGTEPGGYRGGGGAEGAFRTVPDGSGAPAWLVDLSQFVGQFFRTRSAPPPGPTPVALPITQQSWFWPAVLGGGALILIAASGGGRRR